MNICKLFSFINNIFNLLKRNQFLLKQLVVRNIATRYRGSLLGFFWTLVQPLLMLIVYTFVFTYVFQARWGTVLGNNKGAFAMIMFAGIACFNIFSEALTCCSVVIINYPNFVKKVLFPLELIPLATVISSFIIGIPWFIMLLIGSLILLKVFSWTMLLIGFVLFPLFMITLGLGLFIAALGVYLRDLPQLLAILLQVMFFLTPIFYPIESVPAVMRTVLSWNPMFYIVEGVRKVLLYGEVPSIAQWLIPWGVGFLFLGLGYVWFMKTKKGFADVL